jgi:uncharacterized Tic20 family protein
VEDYVHRIGDNYSNYRISVTFLPLVISIIMLIPTTLLLLLII